MQAGGFCVEWQNAYGNSVQSCCNKIFQVEKFMRSAVFLVLLVTLCGCHHHPAQVQSQPPQSIPVQSKIPEPTPTPEVHAGGGGGYCSFSSVTGPVNTPLMIAIWQGDFQKVKELTEANTDLNAKFPYCGSEGHEATPLINAIEGKDDEPYRRRAGMTQSSNYEEVIEFLLHCGASPNVTVHGFSPLHAASELGQLKTVQMLLRYGANLESRYEGETAFMAAAESNGIAVMQKLFAAGANIYAENDLGDNALMLAAWRHQFDAVKLLVKLGINPCLANKKGETALSSALHGDSRDPAQHEIILFLLDACGRSGLVK